MPHPRPSDRFRQTDLGDEYLFYDAESDRMHVLNGTAREIYLLCDGSRSFEEVARAFASRYEVEPEVAVRDARQILDQLAALGLVRLD